MIFEAGDLVTHKRAWTTALAGGPGEVVRTNDKTVHVRVLHACTLFGNDVEAGEVVLFTADDLEIVEPTREGRPIFTYLVDCQYCSWASYLSIETDHYQPGYCPSCGNHCTVVEWPEEQWLLMPVLEGKTKPLEAS